MIKKNHGNNQKSSGGWIEQGVRIPGGRGSEGIKELTRPESYGSGSSRLLAHLSWTSHTA